MLSSQQQAVIEFADTGDDSINVIARAGCGKTYLLVELVKHLVETTNDEIFLGAYNTAIAGELKAKLKDAGIDWKRANASTLHSAGLRAWRYIAKEVEVDGKKMHIVLDNMIERQKEQFDGDDEPIDTDPELVSIIKAHRIFILDAVSFAKQRAFGVLCKVDDVSQWYDLIEHFGLDESLPEDSEFGVAELISVSIDAFKASVAMDKEMVDFDDMLLAPLIHNVHIWQKDWVLLDEAQDTNPVRRALAKKMLKPTGRLVAVGDPAQAIYGFCHPYGVPILTPDGLRPIQELLVGDSVIISSTSGDVSGWSGGVKILECHKYDHSGLLLRITAGDRSIEMTPHHRIPVRIGPTAGYYTYLMRRSGVYRVGSCKAYTKEGGDFMLTHRLFMEKADAAWILGTFVDKESARNAEKSLLCRVKGLSFQNKSDGEITSLPTDEIESIKILGEHGRMLDFPFLHDGVKHRISRNGPFVTEACNVNAGMQVAFYDDSQIDKRKRGRSRQSFRWTPCTVKSRRYSGVVYGITVPSIPMRQDYQSWPLYFGGEGNILVHNTGADSDALDIIADELGSIELPLNKSFRCPKSIVRLAQTWVPDITAHQDNPEGIVRSIPYGSNPKRTEGIGFNTATGETRPVHRIDDEHPGIPKFWQSESLRKDDVILCRNNAPLVNAAFAMIRDGIGCRVEGREIGQGLIVLAQKWRIKTLEPLERRLYTYMEREIQKWQAKGKEEKAAAIEDKVETLLVMIEKLQAEGKTQISDLVVFIEDLFGNTQPGEKPDVLTLSTIHKSKGREWDRVFLLGRNIYQPSKWAKKEWQKEQESNLSYVLVTRARKELVLINV